MKKYYILPAFFPLIFSSCNIADNIGMAGIMAMFGVMLLSFGAMLFLISKKKRQADKSLAKFSYNVQEMLKKFETPEEKIETLKFLIERINKDEHYQKDTAWRDQVLVKTYLYLAGLYHNIGDEAQTLGICTKIIEIDPTEWMTLYNRGSIYSNMGLYEKALHDLNETISLMPKYANAYNNRGLVYDKLGHQQEAIESYSKAIELEKSAISYYNRANTYYELEEYSAALSDYNAYLKLSAEDTADLKTYVEGVIEEIKKK